ncbi:TetR family transcriptional regulator C-terminal domain-containing protein [Actinomadura madurae]|uniref:TetR family transcriptional regulator C-terminal domain-containing protein n=1 Tax=Actinomadura madurae TaxID=1993 RepID=UPI0020D1FC40|nr:TetR family transcriptional regulator C-terminal domain-containing protein [Actinomadura madurae]MCP9980256.1 TetR/AcrR family transcriptional regulator C-terminal ligand-binding domain-containing protein [Actinomadura madurae]
MSYHFHGKQELLTEAAVAAVEAMFPLAELDAVTDLADLVPVVETSFGTSSAPGAVDPVHSGVMVEAMRECGRDPELRGRLTTLLTAHKEKVADLVRAEQDRGAIKRDLDAMDVATLLIATGDGLLAVLSPGTFIVVFDTAAVVIAGAVVAAPIAESLTGMADVRLLLSPASC